MSGISRFFKFFFSKKKILVLGDSHASIFKHWRFLSLINDFSLNVISVGGATISGLKNPNSKTQALPIYRKFLLQNKSHDYIITQLGEVDIGFLVWLQKEKYDKPIEDVLKLTLNSYQKFLLELKKYSKIIVVSAPLPTIKDGEVHGDVANLRKSIKATQLERTSLTLLFNSNMEQFCQQNGIYFLGLDSQSLGSDGLVSNVLLNQNVSDHHYNAKIYSQLIHKKLNQLLSSTSHKKIQRSNQL